MGGNKSLRIIVWTSASAMIALASVYVLRSNCEPVSHRRLRIGVDQAAPYQSWDATHGAVGFSVDVLNEAARRANIQLEWVFRPEGPNPAFAARSVDLWPLWGRKMAEATGAYATKPWLDNQYAVVWRGDGSGAHGPQPDWRGRTISLANLPLSKRLVKQAFPASHQDLTVNRMAAMQQLCTGNSDAVFAEVRLLEDMLLRRPAGCEGIPLRVEVVPGYSQPMSLAAQWEFRREADMLRRQIEVMLRDGRFAAFVDRWFVFSNIEANSMAAIEQQRGEILVILTALAILVPLLALLFCMYRRAALASSVAKRASRAKSDFLANVSHDVRTPMNGILAMADLLLRSSLTPQQRDYTTIIRESADLQLAILNDLLDTAKIESGKLSLDPIPFSPADLLEHLRLAFAAITAQKGLSFSVTGEGLPAAVVGDALRLRQVLTNLVNNAIKFTELGSVSVAAHSVIEAGQARLTFTVMDTGIGIGSDQLGRIFEKFSQADSSTTRRFGGTGLGLSICRSIVELLGGSIQVESAPGKGSRFWFTVSLPMAPAIAAACEQTPSEVRFCSPRPVLVAEDNRVNQKVATSLLESVGLQVDVAQNGLEAVQKCSRNEYAVVLMDCQMPVMDGFEATRRIREFGGRRVPIIALTAAAAETDRERARNEGMDGFIAKPVHREELLRCLRQFLSGNVGDGATDSDQMPVTI